jgi:hypothetical protein
MNISKRIKRKMEWYYLRNIQTSKKCRSFEWHCIVCEAHRYKEIHGGFANTFEELWDWAQPFRKADDAKTL